MTNGRERSPWKQRWLVVLGGFLLAMVGGLSYSWGVFVEPMQKQFGWTKSDATLPLSVFMVVFAIMMIPGGRLQEKIGLKKQIRLGAFLFLLAYILSGLVHFTNHKLWLVFSYGGLGGIACGITYSCIAPAIRRWFPDKPGLAVSLGVMGFGLASTFFAPFKARVALPHLGIAGTFVLTGGITFAIAWVASSLLRFPEDDWFTHLFGTMHLTGHTSSIMEDVTPRKMLREKLFWLTWLAFLCVVFGSLMIIGILPSFGREALRLTISQAAIPLSFFSFTNGLSRPLAGYLSDRIGSLQLMVMVYTLQTAVFLLLPFHINTLLLLNLAGIILGLGIGVTLALFPVLSSEFFGVTHMGINYGLLFSADGFGALAIPVGTLMHARWNSYTPPLLLAGVLSGLGTLSLAGILLFLRKRPH
jgi:OFA family oxalate/formate antiporter-like MFS transporter